jgi:diguanylate cyclase (GGDEF)-like protein
VGWAYKHYLHVAVSETALFPSLFYRFSAGPMAIALFLSEEIHPPKLESFLDSCMVVGLVGLTTYQVQVAELNAHDPKIWQLITIGAVVNLVLVLVAVTRSLLATPGCLQSLFARQAIYLSIYLSVSFITSFADAYLPKIETSVDLIWIVTYLSAAALAVTWHPPLAQERPPKPRISRRTSLLCFNLTLAIMVLSSAALGLRLANSTRVIGLVAVSVVLFSFAVRSALMQDTQERYLAELRESRAQLEHQALYDELTGLPNRRLLADRLSQALAIAQREGHIVALLCLDLDGFKPVNDGMGHRIGDLLLNQVANRMLSRVRKSDTLARMGGDEFTWLVVHLSNKEQAARLAEEMLQTLSEPFEIEGHMIVITASIGIGLFPEGATDPVDLIQQADSAMYAVKRDGKNGVGYFTPELGVL